MKKTRIFAALAACAVMLSLPLTVSAEEVPEAVEEYADPNEADDYIHVTGTAEDGAKYELLFFKTEDGGLEYSGYTIENIPPEYKVDEDIYGYEDVADMRLRDGYILITVPFDIDIDGVTETVYKYYIAFLDGENSKAEYFGLVFSEDTETPPPDTGNDSAAPYLAAMLTAAAAAAITKKRKLCK